MSSRRRSLRAEGRAHRRHRQRQVHRRADFPRTGRPRAGRRPHRARGRPPRLARRSPGSPARSARRCCAPTGRWIGRRSGTLVFADAGKRRVLEGILHPLILDEIDRRIEELERSDPQGVVDRRGRADSRAGPPGGVRRARRGLGRRGAAAAPDDPARQALGGGGRPPPRRADAPRRKARPRPVRRRQQRRPGGLPGRRRARLRRTAADWRARGSDVELPGTGNRAPRRLLRACMAAGLSRCSRPRPQPPERREPPKPPRRRGCASPRCCCSAARRPPRSRRTSRCLKDAGVTTVFVRVFQNRGDRPLFYGGRPTAAVGVYFPTAAAPVVADNLAVVSAACRRLGLSVYAWMTTRACDWLLEERPDLADLRYDSAAGEVLPSARLNIFHPVVRQRLDRGLSRPGARRHRRRALPGRPGAQDRRGVLPRGDRGLPRGERDGSLAGAALRSAARRRRGGDLLAGVSTARRSGPGSPGKTGRSSTWRRS